MSYATECQGTPVVDKSFTTYNATLDTPIDGAWAQKFTPTAVCLASVTLKLQRLFSPGATVYIVPDLNGKPSPNWQVDRFGSVSAVVSTSISDVSFPVNLVLNNLNPIWLVVVSEVYDPALPETQPYLRLGVATGTGTNVFAYQHAGGTWVIRNDIAQAYFMTYKTNPTGSCASSPSSHIYVQ